MGGSQLGEDDKAHALLKSGIECDGFFRWSNVMGKGYLIEDLIIGAKITRYSYLLIVDLLMALGGVKEEIEGELKILGEWVK